jgi:type VI secretion system protein ImpB
MLSSRHGTVTPRERDLWITPDPKPAPPVRDRALVASTVRNFGSRLPIYRKARSISVRETRSKGDTLRAEMGKEASVAPKERVNIVYKPAGDAQEDVELPLRILMLGDFTGKADDTPVEDRKPINIDKDNFNDVLEEHKLGVDINVTDTLSGEAGAEMGVSLKFKSMKDFGPEGIVAQVPELKSLLDLRNALNALQGPRGNVPAFRKKIQSLLEDDSTRAALLAELGAE